MKFAPLFPGLCLVYFSAIADEQRPSVDFAKPAKKESLIKIDSALFPKSLGYEFRANDFEKNPNRQLLAIVKNASLLVEVRGRFTEEKETQEWIIIYREGSPVVAQLKKWRKTKIGGEALIKILTLIPVNGTFTPEDEAHKKCLNSLLAFSEIELAAAKKEVDE
ncbi:MAG: hypothetical protein ABF379_16840 [Akkermansiaceae bacterium]